MKRFLSLILTVALLLSITPLGLFGITANAQNNSTKAVVSDEFIHLTEVPTGYVGIYTKSDLDAIRNDLNGNYILMNDIEFSDDDFSENGLFYTNGSGWTSIGNNETPFTGIFDGNGYGVNGLSISGSLTESPYVGLFGYNKGCIKNITLIGQITITHASNIAYVGMIVGYSEGTIENCKSVGDISVESTILRATYETPFSYVGGITGCSVGTLSLCENTCDIQATPSVIAYAEAAAYLGGVAGVANSSTISNCINSGTITLTPTLDADTGITVYAGGVSGQSNSNTTGCDNSGSVIIEEFKASSTSSVAIEAKFYVAGIIGYSTGTITGSNNAGMIRARGVYAYSGGIAGYNTGTLSQCSNIGNIMAITTSTGSAAYSYGYSGGIAGYSTGTTSESYNTGFVEVNEAGASEAAYSGGIVSYQRGGTIINCYNAGYVPDKTYYGDTGGIAGYSTGSISLCYNIGRVPEGYPSGGGAIVGYTSQITPNCFFLDDNKVGVAEGKDSTISCSKEALLLAATYTGFDFNSVWEIGIYDTYPCATLKNVEHKGSVIGNDLFAGGTGTAYDPFLIENAEQLNNVRVIPSAYYKLIADITFKDSDYTEGGTFYNDGEGWLPIMYFVGSFDGSGHVINNLQIYHVPTSAISSYSSSNALYARYYDDCFGLFGFNCGGTISRVGVTGNIYVKKFDRPSLLDYAYVGGIAGESNGTISECYFIGSVYGTAQYSSSVAGICGWSWTPEGTLENCFSKGTFTGPTTTVVGGITGAGKYSNCYSIGRVVKRNSSADIAIVRGSGSDIDCTEAEMRTQSTYTDFDFNSVWTMEGDVHYLYPELQSVKLDPSLINHTFTKEDTTYLKSEATCTSPAIYYKSCSACGEKGEETFEYGAPNEHSFTREVISDTYKKADATCTEAAIYNYCCATCDAKGTNTYKVGNATGHTTATAVVENKVDANCTVDGSYDSVVYCSVCDAELSREAKTIDKLGHNYETKWTTDLEPTCTTVGSKSHHCTRCGDKVEVTEVAKLGHDYKTVFTWSEDHTSCTVVITCDRGCGLSEALNCTVTHSESNQAQTLHTAVAEYDGKRFTDILTCGNFLITFKDWDGTQISSTYYHAGDTVIVPTDPTRAADMTYTYTFVGWDKTVVDCADNATYIATYTSNYIDYTVVFKNWNGDVLSTKTYHYGDKVTAPANPTRTADKTYIYTFAGWDAEVVNCAGNAEYTATFNAEHYHTYKTSVINPTCTNKGYTKNTCACGNTYNDKYVDSLGHTYSNNCDKACNVCGATRTVGAHKYTNSCDTTCNYCNAKRTIKHTYSNSCDTSCNICKATRTITHSYKTTTTKATLTKNGSIVKKCTVCGKVASNTAIKYVKTFKLSTTTYTYDGKVKTPSVTVKDSAVKSLKKNTDYTVTYASGRKNVGTYKVTIKMIGKYSGTKTLTFKINPAKISSYKLSATSYTYDGNVKKPTVTVKNSSGTKLTTSSYTVTYSSGRKNVGTYKVTIKGKGNYTGTKTLTFKINPAKTTVSKLTAGKKSITVAITKKSTQVTGYQIQYSTSKTFSKATTKTISSYKTTKYTLKSLSAKKTYYVRVRTYKKVGSTTYYSGWSTYKYVKTK